MKLVHSMLITGPSGVGKSTFARKVLLTEGSGIIAAAPGFDELDSYLQLGNGYTKMGFDDDGYFPFSGGGTPTGLSNMVKWLQARLAEVMADVKENKPPRYAVVVVDTLSAVGQLALNATLHKFSRTEPPPAMSPDGAAFYTHLRSRQEELLRTVRAFKGYGVHVIALSHVGESEVSDVNIAKESQGKIRMYTPLVPGGFKLALPSYFSTVLYAGVMRDPADAKKRLHYVQWKPDEKRPTKNRFGDLSTNDKLPSEWVEVKRLVEEAAAR